MKRTEKVIIIFLIIYVLVNVFIFARREYYKQLSKDNSLSQNPEVIFNQENVENNEEENTEEKNNKEDKEKFNEEEILKNIDKEVYIKYTVVNGFSMTGTKLVIKNNGDAILLNNGRSLIRQEGMQNTIIGVKHLKKEFFSDLKKLVNNTKVFDLDNQYTCKTLCPTDLDSTTLEFYKNYRVKRISIYFPKELPEGLGEIIQKLRKIQTEINE